MTIDLSKIPESRLRSIIPTVNNATLTITQGGVSKGIFTANASSDVTIELDAGGGTVDQTYDATSTNAQSGVAIAGAGFLTGITSGDVTTALGYTPASSSSLATVATSGDYDDLSNKPTIPVAQVNSDWNANSGVAEILNKPTLGTMAAESASDYTKTSGLATVATSGSYNDLSNKPTIPTTTDNVTSGSSAALTSGGAYTALQSYATTSAIANMQTTTNLVTSVSSASTDSQYPSAKLLYDTVGNIETLLHNINSGS